MKLSACIVLLSVCAATPALAEFDRHSVNQDQSYSEFGGGFYQQSFGSVGMRRGRHGVIRQSVESVQGRPQQCAHLGRLYCGCASALYAGLGNAKGFYNKVTNWLTLPHTSPAVGMADVRVGRGRHDHVRIIIGSAGNGLWRFYDPNSGKGLTRIVVGQIDGTVVNPGGRI